MKEHKPYSKNVAGDFYVEGGCCTLCSVPWVTAPSLFAVDSEGRHCFVSKQPDTATEMDQMVEVVSCSELACVRYRGTDKAILKWLVAAGESRQCDRLSWWRRLLLPILSRTNRLSQ